MSILKVLHVDEPVNNERMRDHLDRMGYYSICAATGTQALKLYEKDSPDFILVGHPLPDISAIDVCQILRSKSQVPIIMLGSASEDDIITALRAGADDFIEKLFSLDLLSAKMEAVLRRPQMPTTIDNGLFYQDGVLTIDEQRHVITVNGELAPLTPNEFKILLMLAKNPHKVFSRDDLIRLTMGDDYGGKARVVDTHIKSIRKKYEISGQSRVIY